uniref:Uncharacterized protein n=1 Tax=Zea mays TaxID=4577 RepID=A0A804RM98_MAIZE
MNGEIGLQVLANYLLITPPVALRGLTRGPYMHVHRESENGVRSQDGEPSNPAGTARGPHSLDAASSAARIQLGNYAYRQPEKSSDPPSGLVLKSSLRSLLPLPPFRSDLALPLEESPCHVAGVWFSSSPPMRARAAQPEAARRGLLCLSSSSASRLPPCLLPYVSFSGVSIDRRPSVRRRWQRQQPPVVVFTLVSSRSARSLLFDFAGAMSPLVAGRQ